MVTVNEEILKGVALLDGCYVSKVILKSDRFMCEPKRALVAISLPLCLPIKSRGSYQNSGKNVNARYRKELMNLAQYAAQSSPSKGQAIQ